MKSYPRTRISDELISIIMPVKNGMPYLTACLDSIRQQSYENWELHVVNDHSLDDTQAVLRHYAEEDPRIVVHRNEGNGIIDALRTGYHASRGDFVTRMDADDLMPPDKLEHLHALLIERGEGHVAIGAVRYFRDDQPLGEGYKRYAEWLNQLTTNERNFDEIYKECVVPSPNWMMYRTDFERCGGFMPDVYPEDYDLCFRLYVHRMKVAGTSHVTHHWRDYPTRSSRTDEYYADNRFLALKLEYFHRHEFDHTRKLVLWGAGKKGKAIARYLLEHDIPFHWLTNNERKIDLSIYDKILESTAIIRTLAQAQVVIAVANPDEQVQILEEIAGLDRSITPYVFC